MKDLTPESHCQEPLPRVDVVDVVGVHEKTGAEAPVFTFKPVLRTD